MYMLGRIAIWTALIALWTVQYTVVAPMIWLVKVAVGIGVVGLVLLFVPVVGWIILLIVVMLRPRRTPDRSIWRPWFLDLVK